MNALDFLNLSSYLQWLGSFLIIVFAIKYYPNRQTEFIVVGLYGLVSFLFQLLQELNGYKYVRLPHGSVGNLYVLFEAGILLFLFYKTISASRLKQVVVILSLLFLLYYLSIIIDQFNEMSSSIRAGRDVVLMLCSLIYFFYLLRELPSKNLINDPMFWINSAVLFFFSCTFILSLTANYILEALKEDFYLYWSFRNFLRLLFCILICIGMWQTRKESRNLETSGQV